MKLLSVLITFFVVSFWCASAYSKTDQEIEQAIEAMLSQIHPTDTAQDWKNLGEGAPRVIIGMYHKTTQTYRKIRLIEALGWFSAHEAAEFIRTQTQMSENEPLRQSGLRSLAHSQGVAELEFVSRFLADQNPHTRLAAAQALKIMGVGAKDVLENYLRTENVAWISERLNLPGDKKKILSQTKIDQRVTPVGSSENQSQAKWLGFWDGLWLSPDPYRDGVDQYAARLQLKKNTDLSIGGELTLGDGEKIYTVQSSGVEDKTLKGFLIDKNKKHAFVARLPDSRVRKSNVQVIHLEVKNLDGDFLGQK